MTFAERCPNSWQAHYLYARMFDLVKRPQKAITELRRAIELAPGEWKPYSDLGEILNAQGLEKKDPQMLAEAASVLERACALVGLDHPAPHFNLALAYWNLNRPQDTREKLRELLAGITPEHRLYAKGALTSPRRFHARQKAARSVLSGRLFYALGDRSFAHS